LNKLRSAFIKVGLIILINKIVILMQDYQFPIIGVN